MLLRSSIHWLLDDWPLDFTSAAFIVSVGAILQAIGLLLFYRLASPKVAYSDTSDHYRQSGSAGPPPAPPRQAALRSSSVPLSDHQAPNRFSQHRDMASSQDQHSGSSTNPISIEVPGLRSIHIPDSVLREMKRPSELTYYRGTVSCGSQIDRIEACDATVFSYKEMKSASEQYDRLAAFDHRSILEPLGHSKGVVGSESYWFLAVRPFEKTFATYIVRNGPGVDQNGRFTPNFIKLVSDIIDGLEELHSMGYCCPELEGDDIAVIEQADLVTAKLWRFRKSVSGEGKAGVWRKLAHMILVAGNYSKEVTDLFDRTINGKLKGKSMLRHSCLLSVRKKFNNVLAFQFHISNMLSQSQTNKREKLQISELCGANLQNDLDRTLPWTMPAYVTALSNTRPPQTLRGFTKKLRDVFEHEDQFIRGEIRKLTQNEERQGKKPKDLEHHLQDSCPELFCAVQMLVAELNLQY